MNKTDREPINWKGLPIKDKPNHYWCSWCRGTGKHYNKFRQMILCISCDATGIIRDCSNQNCNNVIPYTFHDKCLTCIIESIPDSSPDSPIKDISW